MSTLWRHRCGTSLGGATLWLALALGPAFAQGAPGCAAPRQAADGNVIVTCRRVTIEIEKGADARLVDGDRNGQPRSPPGRSTSTMPRVGGGAPSR